MTPETVDTLRRSPAFDRSHSPGRALGRVLLGWARQTIAWLKDRRLTRRAVHELMGLDDRMLKDIGVTRADIVFAVRRDPQRNL